MKQAILVGAMALLALASTSAAASDPYPVRPVQLVVGYGAGGSTDVCNRALAISVGRTLGQSVVVQNMPGAGSSLSLANITRQQPDGYAIASLATGGVLNQVLNPQANYDVLTDLTPIALVARYQAGVLVRADSPYKTLKELIEASRQGGGKAMNYSTAGVGTPQHLTSERLSEQLKLDWTHVPYKSGAEAVTALMRGDVDFMAQTAEWAPYVRDGRMRLLAVYTGDRMKGFEEAPTLKELGYDMEAPSIFGVVGPAKLPAPIVKRLQDAFQEAMQTKEFQDCAHNFGLRPDYMDSASFGALLADTLTSWTPLLKRFARR